MKTHVWGIIFWISGISSLGFAQLASWPLSTDINGTGGAGIIAHPVAFGSGYSAPNTLLYDFGTNCGCSGLRIWNWRVTGSPAPSLNANTALSQNRYVEFSFTNNTGGPVTVNQFSFEGSGALSTNCSSSIPYGYVRWLVDEVHGTTTQWIRNPSTCSAEHPLTLTGASGSCYSYSRPSAATCSSSSPPGWTLATPVTVASGNRMRIRIYVATSSDQNAWRLVLRNVTITGANPLAVALKEFNAGCGNDGTEVNWVTASEQNASHFDLEYSRDGASWERVTRVPAHGNSTVIRTYGFKDIARFASPFYYRLRQFDFDGMETVYGPIVVNCETKEKNLMVFPNPSSGAFTVIMNAPELLEDAAIVIYDLSGKQLLKRPVSDQLSGTHIVYFEEDQLASGTYLLVLKSKSGNNFSPVKLIIH